MFYEFLKKRGKDTTFFTNKGLFTLFLTDGQD